MRRVISNAVLATQFVGDFVEDFLDLIATTIRPGSRKEPCFSAAGIRERVKNFHVDAVWIGGPAALLLELRQWTPSGNREWKRSAAGEWDPDRSTARPSARTGWGSAAITAAA